VRLGHCGRVNKEEYEAIYAEHIPAMNAARASGDSASFNHHSEVVYHAAKGLVTLAVQDGLKITGTQTDDSTVEVAISAGLSHILTEIAPSWDPEKDLAFNRILSAKKSSWREEASKAARDNESHFRLTVAESNLLRIAGGVRNDYLAEHGSEISRADLIQTLKDRKQALEEQDEGAAARNIKKGFNAALDNAHSLLAASSTSKSFDKGWGTDEEVRLEETAGFQRVTHQDNLGWSEGVEGLAALAGVDLDTLFNSGDKSASLGVKQRKRALERLANPAAQWVFTQSL